jgi:hypothetical protein
MPINCQPYYVDQIGLNHIMNLTDIKYNKLAEYTEMAEHIVGLSEGNNPKSTIIDFSCGEFASDIAAHVAGRLNGFESDGNKYKATVDDLRVEVIPPLGAVGIAALTEAYVEATGNAPDIRQMERVSV